MTQRTGSRTNHPSDDFDLAASDSAAFGRFVVQYERALFGFFGRMGFAQPDCEELAQETFLRVWRFRERHDAARARASTWLFTIARNLALDELDRARRRPRALDAGDEAIDQLPEHHGTGDPAAALDTTRRVAALRAALGRLTGDERTLIALSFVDELSADEAGALLDCAPGTYRTRLSRARQRLAQAFDEEEPA